MARNLDALRVLNKQFRQRNQIYKRYSAIVSRNATLLSGHGEGEISLPLGKDSARGPPLQCVDVMEGKESVTHWRVVALSNNLAHVHLFPKTGR